MKKMCHRGFLLAILLSCSLFFGCDSKKEIVELHLPKRNPTSFVFSSSVSEIHKVIKSLNKTRLVGSLTFLGDSTAARGRNIFLDPKNSQDVYYEPFSNKTSRIYFGKPNHLLPYWYAWDIHIVQLEAGKTSVEIKSLKSELGIGVKFPYNVGLPAEPGAALTKMVEPSTIEEYEYLQALGLALGVLETMPPIVLPND